MRYSGLLSINKDTSASKYQTRHPQFDSSILMIDKNFQLWPSYSLALSKTHRDDIKLSAQPHLTRIN
jgi:hypothetical protein